MSKGGLPPESRRNEGSDADRCKRRRWRLAASLLVALVLVYLASLGLADISERYDLSRICLLCLGAFLAAVGLVMALVAISRGQRALHNARKTPTGGKSQAALSQAHQVRLRSAWMIIVAAGLGILGGHLIWLAMVGR